MAKIRNYIGYGLHADRPTAGAPGALYFESDTGNGYRDNGTSWDQIMAKPFARTVVQSTTSQTLTQGNLIVISRGDDLVYTLPDPALFVGQWITVLTPSGHFVMHNPDGTDADFYNGQPWNGISDGVQWWFMDY